MVTMSDGQGTKTRGGRGLISGSLLSGIVAILWASLAASLAVTASAQDVMGALQNYQSSITVYGDRLPAAERQLLDTAAPIAVVTRDQIAESGAQTVQQALETLPSIVLHNQTGNPRSQPLTCAPFPTAKA